MVAYKLRPATRDDRRSRWKILHETWKTAYPHIYTPDEIEAVFDNTVPQVASWVSRRRAELGYFVAEVGGEMVGFVGMASLYPDFSHLSVGDEPAKEGEITALYLLAPYQGMGIGRALWKAGVGLLRQHSCTTGWVWTIDRAAAVNFYTHLGCVAVDEGTYTVGHHVERAIGFRFTLAGTGG